MNAPVTRRVLLGATAAVGTCALPALAERGQPAAHPDAGLLDLIARHANQEAACDRAEVEDARLQKVAAAAYPPRPEALRWRSGKLPGSYGQGLSDPVGEGGERQYGYRGVDWMRDRPFRVWASPPGAMAPDARSEARRLEIVAAFDAWQAARRKVDAACGWDAASEAASDAADALGETEADILRRRR